MNLKLIEQIPFKEKKLIVSETLLLYSRMKRMKNQQIAFRDRAKDIVRASAASNFKGASLIETIFSLLSAEHALILDNDFVKCVDQYWYLEEWSKTTYYKLKHEAIDRFIYLLYA